MAAAPGTTVSAAETAAETRAAIARGTRHPSRRGAPHIPTPAPAASRAAGWRRRPVSEPTFLSAYRAQVAPAIFSAYGAR
eukprot:6301799-Pyramimonas_sp.AAC.1